jgi:hypothetical protein
MTKSTDIELHINASAKDALNDIRDATEREILPFISASRYPQQQEKGFVSHISGNRFRLWKVPSSSKGRQNVCIPYLSARVRDTDCGSSISGSFRLHPFGTVMALIPFSLVLLVWLGGLNTLKTVLLFCGVAAIALLNVFATIGAVRRLRAKEQEDIRQFIFRLFPDARA